MMRSLTPYNRVPARNYDNINFNRSHIKCLTQRCFMRFVTKKFKNLVKVITTHKSLLMLCVSRVSHKAK